MADALAGGRSAGSGDYRRKILSVDSLLPSLEEARRQGWTIVQCHGCFDIVHPGHVRYLQFARQQGDILIVSITGDAAIDKGELRPYIPEELRAENLAALEFVDYVVVDSNASACKLLGTLRPDVYVKGQEYATSSHAGFLAERETVDSYGGRVVFSSGDVVFSSTRLIESLETDEGLDRQRLASVCGRHGISLEAMGGLLEAMRRKRVLIVGDSVVDRYVLCEAESIASEAPVMSLRALDQKEYAGAAAAIALQVAALGATPVLVTTLGSDERSEWLRRQLRNANVELIVPGARRAAAARTRYLVDEQKVVKIDETEVCPLDSIGERQAADAMLEQARVADVAIICDGGLGTITPGLLSRLGGSFHQRCATVVGTPFERRADILSLRHLSLCVCSERQLRTTSRDSSTGLSSLAYQALAATQSQRLLVTLGKRGMVTFDRPTQDPGNAEWAGRLRSEHLPALSAHSRDRVGCGESVAAAAGLAMSVGASLMQTAYLASAAAAMQVERLGHATIGTSMMRNWLRRREELCESEGEAGTTAARARRRWCKMVADRFPANLRLSIIIPTRDRRDVLAKTLPAVLRELREGDEAIVVDNGSTDGTVAGLRGRLGGARWIELGANLSCASRNVGAAAACGDVLVMMDDDSVPEAGAFDALREAFGEDAGLGAVACRIRLMHAPGRHDAGGLAGVVVNCGAAIRRDAFLGVGGFPIDFDYYAEEYDLCCRLWRAGWRVAARGDISFLHARSAINRDANRMVERLVRNNLRVWGRYSPEARREQLMLETIDRYAGVAAKESALEGFERGLAGWRDENARGLPRARPLNEAHLEQLFGTALARPRLSRQRDRLSLRRVGVCGRGKGCPQLLELLREIHLDVTAIYEDSGAGGRWQGVPIRARETIRKDRPDALVPGTLSLGAAEDQGVELRGEYPDVAVLSAIDWTATTRGVSRIP